MKKIIIILVLSFITSNVYADKKVYNKETRNDEGIFYRVGDLGIIVPDEFDKDNYTVREDTIYGLGKLKFKSGIKFNEVYEGSIYLGDVESIRLDKFDVIITILVSVISVGILFWSIRNFGKTSSPHRQ